MPADFSLLEHAEKNFQFFVFLFSTCVLCMGVANWVGRGEAYKHEKSRRKKLGLPVASLFSRSEQAFTYTRLFNDGLIVVAVIAALLLYRMIAAAISSAMDLEPDPHTLMNLLPLLFVMGVILKIITALRRDDKITRSFFVIALSIGSLSCAAFYHPNLAEPGLKLVEPFLSSTNRAITIKGLSAAVLVLCLSYTIGTFRGIAAADPEINYPLVNVRVFRGDDFNGVWLYERTNSDYRILTKAGSNHIIPVSNVKEIKALVTDSPSELDEE
jgi:hypothetical protein